MAPPPAHELRLAVEDPGELGGTSAAVAAAGCARPDLWEIPPVAFADGIISPGALRLHVAPCLCVARGAADGALPGTRAAALELARWEAMGGAALEPCLPEHPWYARGGSGCLVEGVALSVADALAQDHPAGLAAFAPRVACAGALALLSRLVSRRGLTAERIRREVRASAVGHLREDGALGLPGVERPAASRWSACHREAMDILGEVLASALRTPPSGRAGVTAEEALMGQGEDKAERLLEAAAAARGRRRRWIGLVAPHVALYRRHSGAGLTQAIPHIPLGSSGAVAHILAASTVEDVTSVTGAALEALLYVDGGSAGGSACTAAFRVGPCRTLPRVHLMEWRCQFSWRSRAGARRSQSSPAAVATHFGAEAILHCALPPALARRLVAPSPRAAAARWRLVSADVGWSAEREVTLRVGQLWHTARPRWAPGGDAPKWGFVGCSAPMWLRSPAQAHLVREWLAYHRRVGFDRFVVYDLDGSVAEAVEPFVREGFVIYVDRWPGRLSPGACEHLHKAADVPGRKEQPWMRYCTQTQAEQHCVWNLRGHARWAVLLHSFDAYASSVSGLVDGLAPLLRRLEPLRASAATFGLLRYDFGGHPRGGWLGWPYPPTTQRFTWRQRAPAVVSPLSSQQRGGLDAIGASAEDHAGAVLVNPINAWSVYTHWARGRPGSVHLTMPPELLRVNHYVDIMGEPRCARAASQHGDPPCDVFDNSSAWASNAELFGSGKVLVVVPGHGGAARSETLEAGLQHIAAEPWPKGAAPDCLVFLYREGVDTRALDEHGCQVELRPGGVFLGFLADPAMADALRRVRPDFVALLIDDIAIKDEKSPTKMLELTSIMRRNSLDVATPALIGTHSAYDGMRPSAPRRLMAKGRLVTFIEFQSTVFTLEAFQVLMRMVRPSVSRTWGYDVLFPGAFLSAMGRPPRMAVVDIMLAVHTGKWTESMTLESELVIAEYEALLRVYERQNITPARQIWRRGYIY